MLFLLPMEKPEQHVLHLLQVAAHRVRTHTDRRGLVVAGITTAQAGALFVIADRPGVTQREIAKALKLRESAVTGMIARLHRAGLVERRYNSSDQRARSWMLTQTGQEALQSLRTVLDEVNGRLTDALGEEEFYRLDRLLQLIVDSDI